MIWPAFRDAWLAVAHAVAQSGCPWCCSARSSPGTCGSFPPAAGPGDIRFLGLDCPDELRRDRISARPSWRSRDIDEQAEFGRWLRRNIPDRVDTGSGTPEDTVAAVTAWIEGHLRAAETPAG